MSMTPLQTLDQVHTGLRDAYKLVTTGLKHADSRQVYEAMVGSRRTLDQLTADVIMAAGHNSPVGNVLYGQKLVGVSQAAGELRNTSALVAYMNAAEPTLGQYRQAGESVGAAITTAMQKVGAAADEMRLEHRPNFSYAGAVPA